MSPLLEPTAEERALAAKILGTGSESDPPDNKAAGAKEPEKDAEGAPPAEKDAAAATAGDAEGDDTPEEPVWYKKRIAKLTKQLRETTQTMTAREMARDAEVRAMREELAELKKARTAPPPLGDDATPEQITAYWEQRLEAERTESRNQRMADRLELQVESLRDKHDGTDGKPSYDELYERYAPQFDQLPAYLPIKARIQQAPNMPREFYRQAIQLWEAEERQAEDNAEELDRERDAGRTTRATTNARKSATKDSPTEYEREWTSRVFGDRVKAEDIAKQRLARTKQ